MPALGTIVSSITNTRIVPKVVDNVLRGNVLLMRLMRDRTSPWTNGVQYNQPVNLTAYTALGSFSGFDTLASAQQSTRQNAIFNPSEEYVLISVSGIQAAINRGPAAAVDLITAEMQQRGNDLKDEMGQQLYKDGTGNTNKDLLGLAAAVDDATNVGTYGGLSRATYTNWKATYTAQSGALALSDLASDVDAATVRSDDPPTLIVTTQAIFTIVEALFTPTTQNMYTMGDYRLVPGEMYPIKIGVGGLGQQGFRALTFRGIPLVADQRAPSGKIWTLNENHFKFAKIDYGAPFATAVKDGFQWTGLRLPVNQIAATGYLLWAGQFICDEPRVNAQRVSVTS